MVVPLRHLGSFRVEGVYRPAVMGQLKKPWDAERGEPRQWSTEAEALETILRHPGTKDRLKST